jgi:predicted DNA-binding ribbon-helix-helix protein
VSAGQRKRSITIAGHRTSISLEDAFWEALGEIADRRGMPVAALVAEIDRARAGVGLSAAIRLHVLNHYRCSGRQMAGPPD